MVLQAYNPRTWKVEAEGIQGQNKLGWLYREFGNRQGCIIPYFRPTEMKIGCQEVQDGCQLTG